MLNIVIYMYVCIQIFIEINITNLSSLSPFLLTLHGLGEDHSPDLLYDGVR